MKRLMLLCTIAGRQAAIPALAIRSVIEIDAIEPIPGTAPWIAGLTALRSQALTVIGGFGKQWAKAAVGMVETPRGPAIILDIPALLGLDKPEAA